MRSVIPLIAVITGCASCVTTQGVSLESECLRLLRCEIAWAGRDLSVLIHERCDDPPGFSMESDLKTLAGLSQLDCAWNRGEPAEDEGPN